MSDNYYNLDTYRIENLNHKRKIYIKVVIVITLTAYISLFAWSKVSTVKLVDNSKSLTYIKYLDHEANTYLLYVHTVFLSFVEILIGACIICKIKKYILITTIISFLLTVVNTLYVTIFYKRAHLVDEFLISNWIIIGCKIIISCVWLKFNI